MSMMTIEALTEKWRDIKPEAGKDIERRVEALHPLDIFVGYDGNLRPQLTIYTDIEQKSIQSSAEIDVQVRTYANGRYALCMVLKNTELLDLFILLVWDIASSTQDAHTQKAGIESAVKRFEKWQKLLADCKGENVLSDIQIRGLWGELWYLWKAIMPQFGLATALEAWVGPMKADRDFELTDWWYEVKTTSLSRNEIRISSLDQLDTDKSGYLVTCRIEETTEIEPNSYSLNSLISAISASLDEMPKLLHQFMLKLRLAGYHEIEEYSRHVYNARRVDVYRVNDGFPCLSRRNTANAIIEAGYTLSTAALSQWLIEDL